MNLNFAHVQIEDKLVEVPLKGKKKTEEKNQIMNGLQEKVKEKLGISFENFTELIVKD